MKKFFSFIVKQSVACVLFVVFVLAFGVYSTLNMAINLLPDINVPMVCIQVIYPGASATSAEKDVTIKLEDGLKSISGVTDVQSYSYDNLSAVVLSFDYGTDTDEKKADITSKLSSLDLPDGITTTVYDIDLNSQALAVLTVTGGNSLTERYAKANLLKTSIQGIDGVESVTLKGGGEQAITIKPFGGAELISLLFVQAFSYEALDIPLGNISVDGADVQIRNQTFVTTKDEVEAMPISLPSSYLTLLRAIKQAISVYESISDEQINAIQSALKSGENVDEQLGNMFGTAELSDSAKEVINKFISSPNLNKNLTQIGLYHKVFGSNLNATGYYNLFSSLDLSDVLEVTLSEKLIDFITSYDLDNTTTNSDGDEVLVVSVSDIADVEYQTTYSSYAYYIGGEVKVVDEADSQVVMIEVYKSNGANSSAVVSKVKAAAEELGGQSAGFTFKLLDDQSEFISDSISNVLVSMLIGGVLAIIIIFIFLKKVKLSLIIAVTMPLSVLAALICMFAMGITLNMVSLGGLAVGIGMLVDNSIVVIEAISKHRDSGKTAYCAAVDGVTEVGGALFGSTITTICVFIPIIMSGGLTGEIFTDLSWAVIFSLTFSLIIALTVIPTLYSMVYGGDRVRLKGEVSRIEEDNKVTQTPVNDEASQKQPEKSEPKAKTKFNVKGLSKPLIMERIDRAYKRVLPACLGKKVITICVAIVVFAGSVGLVTLTGTEFLPSIDKGQIEVNMSYGATADIEEVQDDVFAFCKTLNDNLDNVEYVSASVGRNGLLALTDTGIVTVQLSTNRDTDKVVNTIRQLAKTSGVKGTVTVRQIDGVVASLMSGSNNMSLSILGEDTQKLKSIADDIESQLSERGFTDITNSLTDKSTQYRLEFDEKKIAEYGLDYYTIVMTMRVGIASYTVATLEIEGQEYSLNVQFNDDVFPSDKDTATMVKTLADYIVGYSGTTAVHLKDILKQSSATADTYGIIVEQTDACIRRTNGYNTITVSAQHATLDTGSASNIMQQVAKDVLAKEEYSGYSFVSSGISSYLTDAFEGLAVALVVSFFLLYAVMAIQFSSFIKPIIVMASIPFSFTGGFLALVITGTSLNVVSFIGLIMLMGVIVNNAIVMLEKIGQLHADGMEHYQAVQTACSERLRPILMTTLTTILALVPMAIGVGKGSELMQPLGIVVMGGLLIGTLVTLVLVPCVYCLFYGLSKDHPEGKKAQNKKEQ